MSIQKHFEGYSLLWQGAHGGRHHDSMSSSLTGPMASVLRKQRMNRSGTGLWSLILSPSDQFPPGVHSPKGSATLPNSIVSQLVTKMFKCLWHSHSNHDRGWDRFGVSLGYILRSAQKPTHRIEEKKGLPCSIIILTKYFKTLFRYILSCFLMHQNL